MPRRDDDHDDEDDDRDEKYRKRRRQRDEEEDEDRPKYRKSRGAEEEDEFMRRRRASYSGGGLIPFNNSMALISYYCGVFALILPLAIVLGPVAIILGFMGLGKAKEHPEAKGKAHAITGIVLGFLTLFALIAAAVYFILG
jgi:hypothetical protein